MSPLADALIPDSVRYAVRRRRHRGESRYCPVCDSHLDAFRSAGEPPRPQAECPVCDAMERHRLLALALADLSAKRSGRSWRDVLHVAPHKELGRFLERRSERYVAGSLAPRRQELAIDITDLSFDDDRFDLILCSHVLEHVLEDWQALGELHRVLEPSGLLLLLVPIAGDVTFEDSSVVSEAERLRVFGQIDHVRICGHDYQQRIEQAGFAVRRLDALDVFSGGRMQTHGGLPSDCVFFCRKSS